MSAWGTHLDLWSEVARWLSGPDLLPLLALCTAARGEARRELLRENREFFERHIVHMGWWPIPPFSPNECPMIESYYPPWIYHFTVQATVREFSDRTRERPDEPLVVWTRAIEAMRRATEQQKPDGCRLKHRAEFRELARAARAALSLPPSTVLFFRHLARPASRAPLEDGRCWIVDTVTGHGGELSAPGRFYLVPRGYNLVRVRQAETCNGDGYFRSAHCSLRISPKCRRNVAEQCGWCRVYCYCAPCAEQIGMPRCCRCERLSPCCQLLECDKCQAARCWICPCACIPKRLKRQ